MAPEDSSLGGGGTFRLSSPMTLRRKLRELVRERLAAGDLLPEHPELPGRPGAVLVTEVRIGTIPDARCTLCGHVRPHISYTYLDRRVLRLHGACDMAWHEEAAERQRRRTAPPKAAAKPRARATPDEPR